jgi:hypothetical protein
MIPLHSAAVAVYQQVSEDAADGVLAAVVQLLKGRTIARYGEEFHRWRLASGGYAWLFDRALNDPPVQPGEARAYLEATCPPDVFGRAQAHARAYRAAGGA